MVLFKPVQRDRDPGSLLKGTIPEDVRARLLAAEQPAPKGIPSSSSVPDSTAETPPEWPDSDEEASPAVLTALPVRLGRALGSLLVWVGIPVAAIALAFAFNAGLLVACFYAFLFLVVVSQAMVFFWLRTLRCERELNADVVEIGDTVSITTKLTNTSPWPILWVYAEETLPRGFPRQGTTRRLIFLPPGRSFHLTTVVRLTRRGCHQIGPVIYESGDVFGLFRRCRIDPRLDFVTVLPGYDVLEQFEPGRQRRLGDLAAMRSLFEDVTRLRGIREYRRGDPLNRIHWKSTARRGSLYSKIYDPIIEAGAVVVLDFHRDAWKRATGNRDGIAVEDEAAELACTVASYLAEGGWKVGLLSNGRDPLGLAGRSMAQARASDSLADAEELARRRRRDTRLEPVLIPPREGLEQFTLIREQLGRLALSSGLPIERAMFDALPRLGRGQVLVLITGELPDDLVTSVLRARELGFRMMVFVIGNVADHDRALPLFLGAGVELFHMDQNWRIREIATGRRTL